MCLVIKKEARRGKIAWKPIKCFKFVVETKDGSFYSPYQLTPIETSVINGDKQMIADGKLTIDRPEWYSNIRGFIIKGGAIHTSKYIVELISMVTAETHMADALGWNDKKLKIYECVIPRFARYYEGETCYTKDFGEEWIRADSFASKRLRFKRFIQEIEIK